MLRKKGNEGLLPEQSEAARLGIAPYVENYGFIKTSTPLIPPGFAGHLGQT